MQKVFNVAVDIGRKLPAPAFEVNTNDLKSVKLLITITNGQTLLDLTDTTVRIAIRKPDNHIIFQDCTVKDAKNGQVEIILENQAYITPGTHTAEIMCYKGSDVVAVSGTFSYKSTKGIMNDEAVESKSEFTTISNMMKDVQETIDDIRENGTGVDAKARQDIQSVTTQLAEKVNKGDLAPLVNKDYVDSQILTVNTGGSIDLSRKADVSYVKDSVQGREMLIKHKALVIPSQDLDYTNPMIDQLRMHGFSVDLTSPAMFVKHFDELDHDILVMSARIIIPHYETLTAQQYKDKLTRWLSLGKKVVFFAPDTLARIEKSNADGTLIENVSMKDILSFTISTVSGYDMTGSFTRINPTELTSDAFIDSRYKPQSFVIHCWGFSDGAKALVRATQGNIIADSVVIKPNQYVFVGWGGFQSGQEIKDITGYRYVDVGLLAKRLVGDSSDVRLAFDCKFNKKIAASGIDCDMTIDKDAVKSYVEAYKGRPLEVGTHVGKLTPSLANFYRSLTGVELVSHSTYHTVDRVTITDETHLIPAKQFIRIEAPYLPEIEYIKTTDDSITFASASTLAAGKYNIDDYGVVTFHSSDIGKRIKIKYTHIKEAEEWVGGIDKLKELGALTNKAIYTTNSYKAIHSGSVSFMKRENITICHYESFPSNKMFYYYAFSGIMDKVTPPIGTGFGLGYGRVGWDAMFYKPKTYSKETHFPEMVADADRRHFPYLWYSHDFLFSQSYWAGIWTDTQKRYDADWKKPTFAETVSYAQEMVSWALDQLDSKNVYWMVRSDYSRWFEALNQSVEYDIKNTGSTTDILVRNKGDKNLQGLTFRVRSLNAPAKAYTIQGESLPFAFKDGETRVSLNLQPGSDRLIRLEFSR